jgi:hypothetical protein
MNRLHVRLRIHLGHGHALRRAIEAGRVIVRTEQIHTAVGAAQRLHPLEYRLAAVE